MTADIYQPDDAERIVLAALNTAPKPMGLRTDRAHVNSRIAGRLAAMGYVTMAMGMARITRTGRDALSRALS